jgi:hypothetical protein
MARSSLSRTLRLPQLRLARLDLRVAVRRWQALALAQLGPIVGILILVCGVLWATAEYAAFKSELRVAETNRHLAEFRQPPVADAWRRLSAAWEAEGDRQDALLRRLSGLSGTELGRGLRDYRWFVTSTIADRHLEQDIDTVLRFYRRLALCIRIGSCDPAAAAAQLGDTPWRFRNQHYFYLEAEYAGEDIESDLELISPRPQAAADRVAGLS